MEAVLRIDRAAMLAVRRLHLAPLTWVMKIFTLSGTARAWLGFALVLNVLQRAGAQILPEQELFLRSMISALIAWGAGWVLKRVFQRRRPPDCMEGIDPLVPSPTCGSFPSSHAATSMAFFFALAFVGHPLAALVGAWALLVTFSRLYLGVHFPSDLFGGAVLGFLAGLCIFPLSSLMAITN